MQQLECHGCPAGKQETRKRTDETGGNLLSSAGGVKSGGWASYGALSPERGAVWGPNPRVGG